MCCDFDLQGKSVIRLTKMNGDARWTEDAIVNLFAASVSVYLKNALTPAEKPPRTISITGFQQAAAEQKAARMGALNPPLLCTTMKRR